MAKDHFIPASLIARFSEDTEGPARKRKVWTLRNNGVRVEVRAEKIGYTNNLYNVDDLMFPTHGAGAVDNVWRSYESGLPQALDHLIAGSLTAAEWIDTLVPFVAATFARDRGYKERVKGRLAKDSSSLLADPELEGVVLDDTNIALNRILEMERFAARALASTWTVLELREDIVLPDVGYGFELVSECPDVVGTLFPIGPRHVLMLIPSAERYILTRAGEVWTPVIEYREHPVKGLDLNRELVKTAQDFVVGPQGAIGQLHSGELGRFNWHQIDEVLELWPFNIDTRSLSGLHRVVRAVVNENLRALDEVSLNKFQSLSELEPSGMLLASQQDVSADRVLSLDSSGLRLFAHRS